MADPCPCCEAHDAWTWLSAHRELELTWNTPLDGVTHDDDPEEWRVYRVTGPTADPVCELVGIGDTPLDAVLSAQLMLATKARPDA